MVTLGEVVDRRRFQNISSFKSMTSKSISICHLLNTSIKLKSSSFRSPSQVLTSRTLVTRLRFASTITNRINL